MSKLTTLAVLTVAFAALAVSSAVATTGPAMLTSRSPIGVASNTAAVSGNASSFVGPRFTASNIVVACNDANFTVAAQTTNTVTATPSFSGCHLTLSGLAIAAFTVDHNCAWTFTYQHSVFTDATGAGSDGTVDVPCQTTMTFPMLGCTLHLTPFSAARGVTTQNINAGGSNDTSASPWGSKITASLTGLHYTTTGGGCGIPATGNFAYESTVAVRNLWGML